MTKLIGYLYYGHHAGIVHRLAHKWIYSILNTWHGSIRTEVDKEGNASVDVNGKIVWKGNINQR